MKNKLLIFSLLLAVVMWVACDKDDDSMGPTDRTDLGQGLFINQSELRPAGVDTLFINEGDTVQLVATTILPLPHKYSWTSSNEKVFKTVSAGVDSVSMAIAVGDSGTAASLTLVDAGNANASKTIPVKIVKYWAEPLEYIYLGSLGGHHYYRSQYKALWPVAVSLCEEAGGHLVTIQSKEENDIVHESRENKSERVWIGLTFLFDNDELTHWITGEPVEYTNWRGGKPSEPGIFAEFYFYVNEEGKWYKWHEENNWYVLEFEPY